MKSSNLIEVRAGRRPNGRYRYTGLTTEGDLVVLRKSATRLYPSAFFYGHKVSSGTTGLAAHFLYGKTARPQYCLESGSMVGPTEIFAVIYGTNHGYDGPGGGEDSCPPGQEDDYNRGF